MKIESIKLENNEILGSLFLDFKDKNGKIIDTIILAGENACGKSTILNIIYEFSNYNLFPIKSNEKREFMVQLTNEEYGILRNHEQTKMYFQNGILKNELIFKFDFRIINDWNQIKVTYANNINQQMELVGNIFASNEIKSIFKSIFSDVEINFNPQNIQSVTSKDIDQKIYGSIKSSSNLATEITQLLIDIQSLDDAEFTEWGRNNVGRPVDNSKLDLRIGRFKEAFNFMFPTKRYKKIKNENNVKKVLFEEFGSEIPIEKLSSGEKQIVFRGSFLLKDQKSNKGALVLIDEPEISLHPKWQLKILGFFKKLFTDENGIQTSQIIIATHSPFIVHNDSRLNDRVIVLNKDSDGNIYLPDTTEYFGWTPEKVVSEAFNIDFVIHSEKPIVFVEGDYDIKYINKAAKVFGKESILAQIGLKDGGGYRNLDKIWNIFVTHLTEIKSQKIILLYDCDTEKLDLQEGNFFKRRIPSNADNPVKKGIENLFPYETILKAIKHKSAFIDITEETKMIIRGDEIIEPKKYQVNKDEKGNLCNWLCENGTKEDFSNFAQIFTIIENIV